MPSLSSVQLLAFADSLMPQASQARTAAVILFIPNPKQRKRGSGNRLWLLGGKQSDASNLCSRRSVCSGGVPNLAYSGRSQSRSA